jgi:outer membrane protein insertion porin family
MKCKKLVLAAALLACSSYSMSQTSNEFIVEDIRVEGLQRVALGAALTYLPVQRGDTLNRFRVTQLIRSLYSSTHFEKVEIFRDGNVLIVKVSERPTISNIVFDGNDDIKDEQLQESLDSSNIRIGEPLDRTVITSIENGLKDFFYSIGKYNADVSAIVTPLPRNRVDVKLLFEEGDAAKIRQINIVGNEVFEDDELYKQMELKFNTPWWDFMSETRYQQQTLSGDMENIESYYKDRGYLQFGITSTQVSMTPEKDGIYVTMNIDEGEQYDISEVELAGDLLGYEDFISRLLPLRVGDLYNQGEVTYTEINEEDKTVKLILNVDPGKRIYVRRITFTGNQVTADNVLRQSVVQMEGSWLANQSLESSKAQLSRLTYMEEVEFETIRLPGEDDKVDVEFTVKEQASGSFNAGIGYGDATKLSLQAGVQQDNFLGTGKRVGINLNTVSYQSSAQLTYLDPYFTIDGISLGGTLGYSEFDGGDFGLIQYSSKRWSIGANLGYPINEVNRISFGLTYSNVELGANNTPYVQTTRFYEQFADPNDPDAPINYDSLMGSVSWTRNTLNRGLFPSAGSSQRASLSVTTPNSEVNYFKFTADAKWYFPLTRNQRWTVLARLRLGYGNGYGEKNDIEQILPFNENFTAGGADTLRGFENNTVGPRGVQRVRTTLTNSPTGVPILASPDQDTIALSQRSLGGNAMALGGVELIVPTPFVDAEFDNSVRTSIFYDIGNVWDTEFQFDEYKDLSIIANSDPLGDYSDWTQYRSSGGVSVQWISPMGPMVFSFSRALKEREGDDAKFFTFNIGSTF